MLDLDFDLPNSRILSLKKKKDTRFQEIDKNNAAKNKYILC